MKRIKHHLKRISGYIAGFALFFAPLAIFQRVILLSMGQHYDPAIHTLCFRIPIEHILDGTFFQRGAAAVTGTILLLAVSFFWGPLFCGKLCPTGALTEYLSRLLPDRMKINWSRYFPIPSVRYGFLAGFIIAPFWGGYLACSYCNYYTFDLIFNFILAGFSIIAFSSSLLLTMLLWLFIFGIFTQGGRGFCNFFCPVGASQNFVYYLGSFVPWHKKIIIDHDKCVNCKLCINHCPMTCMDEQQGKINYSIHHCILCMECRDICPCQAVYYGRKTGRRAADAEAR